MNMKTIDYFDKNGSKIDTGDTLAFDNGSIFKVINIGDIYCLQCISHSLPMILLDKICVGSEHKLYSAVKVVD